MKNQAAVPPAFDNLPAELKKLDRWVGWRYEQKSGSEKAAKVPKITHGQGGNASSTNPVTWGTFAQAEAAYMDGGLSGVGIVLNGDGLVGVDLDHCVIDGVPSAKAMALLDKLGAGYIEVSPSGTGLRALGYGEQIKGVNGSLGGLKAEFYSSGRYLTLTGQTIKVGPITPLKDFSATADSFSPTKATKVNQETGEIEAVSTDEKQGALIQRLLSGSVYHDSLRDLAAAWVSQGMVPAAAIAALRGLMDNAERRAEWQARRDQIPDLVASAHTKFQVHDFPDQLEQVTANPRRYKLLGDDEIAALPPLRWRVRGVLPAVGVAAGYGPSGSGKSFLFFDMACAIASGERWFDCRVEAAPVVYLVLEGEGGLHQRVAAWKKHTGRRLPTAIKCVVQPFTLTIAQDLADMADAVPAGAVIVVDTLNRAAASADENSSRDMGQILEATKALQARTGGLVVLVHHTGKDTSKGLRGHSSLFAGMDACVEVGRDGASASRWWTVAKAKDGRDGGMHGFTLEGVSMGVDAYDDPIDSCVVVPTGTPVAHQKSLTPNTQMGLTAINAALDADLFGSSIQLEVWRAAFYLLHPSDITDSKRTAFKRAVAELVKDGYVSQAKEMFSIPDF
ncbi:MAG: AAA family ATPase [Rhodoferax sp.]|nr:AAA family ATPase [Rhodoferax sp.]